MTMTGANTDLDGAVRDALSKVYDPCSVAAGRPTSLMDMGMVVDWGLTGTDELTVTLCVTFSGCTMAPHFVGAAVTALERIDGIRHANVVVDTDFHWSPERMARPKRISPPPGLEPQAWRKRA